MKNTFHHPAAQVTQFLTPRRGFVGLVVAAVLFGFTSCASGPKPVRSGREGLIQRLNKLDSAQGSRVPASERNAEAVEVDTSTVNAIRLRWPLKSVEVTSTFGQRGSEFHEGVDLRAPVGTPVYAAQSGVVLYAGSRIRGYGKMVVLKHSNGWATVYAHNSKLLVHPGQKLKAGQRLAISGRSGKVRGPHVHFEVRNGTSPIDPIRCLPDIRVATAERTQVQAHGRKARMRSSVAKVVAQARR